MLPVDVKGGCTNTHVPGERGGDMWDTYELTVARDLDPGGRGGTREGDGGGMGVLTPTRVWREEEMRRTLLRRNEEGRGDDEKRRDRIPTRIKQEGRRGERRESLEEGSGLRNPNRGEHEVRRTLEGREDEGTIGRNKEEDKKREVRTPDTREKGERNGWRRQEDVRLGDKNEDRGRIILPRREEEREDLARKLGECGLGGVRRDARGVRGLFTPQVFSLSLFLQLPPSFPSLRGGSPWQEGGFTPQDWREAAFTGRRLEEKFLNLP